MTGTCPLAQPIRQGQRAKYESKLPYREAPACLPRPKGVAEELQIFTQFVQEEKSIPCHKNTAKQE